MIRPSGFHEDYERFDINLAKSRIWYVHVIYGFEFPDATRPCNWEIYAAQMCDYLTTGNPNP